jgi:hypothetical protein
MIARVQLEASEHFELMSVLAAGGVGDAVPLPVCVVVNADTDVILAEAFDLAAVQVCVSVSVCGTDVLTLTLYVSVSTCVFCTRFKRQQSRCQM